MSQITEFKMDPRDGTCTFERADGSIESFNLGDAVSRNPVTGSLQTPDGQVVGAGYGSLWAYRPFGGNIAEVGFANSFQEVIEVPFEPGQVVEVSAQLLNDLVTDTGTGPTHNDGNGRYGIMDMRFASGSSFSDPNALLANGVTPAPFVTVPEASYTSVDGLGPSSMTNFVPASPENHMNTGRLGLAYSPPVLLELLPRRDGRPGSLIYMQVRTGGAGALSQHSRGIIQNGSTTMHTLDVPYRRRGYWYNTFDPIANLNWSLASSSASQFFQAHLHIRSLQKSIILANCGDSTQQGGNTPNNVMNATHQTVQAFNASKFMGAAWGYMSYCQGGMTAPWFHGLLRDQLLRGRTLPDVVFVQVTSQATRTEIGITEPYTAARISADWQSVLGLVDLGERLGVKVVPMTQPPTSYIQDIWQLGGANQTTAFGMESRRNKLNDWIRASGVPYLDVDRIVTGGTYANGIAFLSGYTGTGDGYRPNFASHTAVSLAQQAMIPQILGDLAAKGVSGQPPIATTYAPTANGTATVFAFPHGRGVVPSDVSVTPRNALSVSQPFALTWDINQVYITYSTAPAAGALSFLVRVSP